MGKVKKDNDIPLKDNINDNVLENNIYDYFERPYIVQVAYDLNRKDADEIARLNLDESEVDQYIRENIIENYNSDGFLALSSIGEFVLIRRFQQAIENLEKDYLNLRLYQIYILLGHLYLYLNSALFVWFLCHRDTL